VFVGNAVWRRSLGSGKWELGTGEVPRSFGQQEACTGANRDDMDAGSDDRHVHLLQTRSHGSDAGAAAIGPER
jgi:hypothetical protein